MPSLLNTTKPRFFQQRKQRQQPQPQQPQQQQRRSSCSSTSQKSSSRDHKNDDATHNVDVGVDIIESSNRSEAAAVATAPDQVVLVHSVNHPDDDGNKETYNPDLDLEEEDVKINSTSSSSVVALMGGVEMEVVHGIMCSNINGNGKDNHSEHDNDDDEGEEEEGPSPAIVDIMKEKKEDDNENGSESIAAAPTMAQQPVIHPDQNQVSVFLYLCVILFCNVYSILKRVPLSDLIGYLDSMVLCRMDHYRYHQPDTRNIKWEIMMDFCVVPRR